MARHHYAGQAHGRGPSQHWTVIHGGWFQRNVSRALLNHVQLTLHIRGVVSENAMIFEVMNLPERGTLSHGAVHLYGIGPGSYLNQVCIALGEAWVCVRTQSLAKRG